MERILLEERLKTLSQDSGWPLDSVKLAWEALQTLPQEQRAFLTGERLAAILDYSPAECLHFLLAGTKSGIFEQRWCIFSPRSGWVLAQRENLGQLTGEKLRDPFSGEMIEPDLDQNILVTFSPKHSFFDDKPLAYDGLWEQYRLYARAFPHEADGQLVVSDFKVFNPWELGKVEVKASAGEVYNLITLEGRDICTVTVVGTEPQKPTSFIEKMVKYKAAKSAGVQTFDLILGENGFEKKDVQITVGRTVFWVENRSGTKIAIMVWKAPIPVTAPSVASFLKGRSLINNAYYRGHLAVADMPSEFCMAVSDQTCVLFQLEVNPSLPLDEQESYHLLRKGLGMVENAATSACGHFISRQTDSCMVVFSDPCLAIQLFGRVCKESLAAGGSPLQWKAAVVTGKVRLINRAGKLEYYGGSLTSGAGALASVKAPGLLIDGRALDQAAISRCLTSTGFRLEKGQSHTPGYKLYAFEGESALAPS